MRISLSLALLLVLGTTARASDPIGIYAILDKVVLEPNDQTPERLQLHGVFSLPESGESFAFKTPVRGYMYYALPRGKEDLARREWADLKRHAEAGRPVAYSSRFEEHGRIRKANEPVKSPDPYPIAFGVFGVRANSVVRQMQALPAPVTPSDGEQVVAGAITLRTRNIVDNTRKNVKYVFEIENGADKEASKPVTPGDKETTWMPQMSVKPGQKYTWRVWIVDGSGRGPVASASFQGKSVQ